MCNNILQYGHLYAWGREHHRTTMSMRFAYKYQYFHICNTPHHNFATYLFAKYASKWRIIPTVSFHEEGEDTDDKERVMNEKRMVVAEGWYARFPDLFLKYKKEIIALFCFLPSIENSINEKISALRDNSTKLGVHIRRGDYATWHGGKFLYTDEQYISIIQQFITLHADQKVDIFISGNDPNMDKDKFVKEIGTGCLHFAEGNPGEDLCLLSKCDYLIGAPSTFTLVASMYHDTPLYWMIDVNQNLTESSFQKFDHLFRHIL